MRRKAAERLFALEEEDTFPYVLCRDLGFGTVAELDERMGYDEYVRWRAFYNYEYAMQDFERRKAQARG